ncbi:MAG: hypothetical protein U9P00_04460 [Pseudomonadota bacterium]|nr:hypothetical protein [Pseudomonadota bacterium]
MVKKVDDATESGALVGLRSGHWMIGEATLPGHAEYGIHVRFRRRADLPEKTTHSLGAIKQ